MSWMDSWSRPSKQSAVPPPLYLTVGDDVPYCHTCGRVMSARMSKSGPKSGNTNANKNSKNPNPNPVKYCSDRCRNRKPGSLDRKIEKAIVALLDAEAESGVEKTGAKDRIIKGDRRIIVTMDEIEEIMFGSRFDPKKVFGRRKNRASRAIGSDKEWKSVDMESEDDERQHKNHGSEAEHDLDKDNDEDDVDEEDGGSKISDSALSQTDSADEVHVTEAGRQNEELADMVPLNPGLRKRPPQTESEVNFSVGGERGKAEKIEESPADIEKRNEGQKKAEEREMVRRAARRGVVFGFLVDEPGIDQKQTHKGAKRRSKHVSGDEDEAVEGEMKQIRRKCEALMNGSTVVEPSFAKGNWSIRWRE